MHKWIPEPLPVSEEIKILRKRLVDQRAKRSDALRRLKACAQEATKDLPDAPPQSSDITGEEKIVAPIATQQERLKRSRLNRKHGVDILKLTAQRAIQSIRESEILLRLQGETIVETNGNGNGVHPNGLRPQE